MIESASATVGLTTPGVALRSASVRCEASLTSQLPITSNTIVISRATIPTTTLSTCNRSDFTVPTVPGHNQTSNTTTVAVRLSQFSSVGGRGLLSTKSASIGQRNAARIGTDTESFA